MNTNKESSLKNSKVIYDISKFTHLDYPNHLACIVWFSGCNMRCDYCYNKDIVFAKDGSYSYEDVLEFLKTRVGLLDAVVLSGGEATSHNLVEFCKKIKQLGFLIKLDTNGVNYDAIKELIDLDLLDFVALDYKAPKEKFLQITHSNRYDDFSKTLDFLIQSSMEFEVRTTLHNDLLHVEDINAIISDLSMRGYTDTYYIQKFLDTGTSIGNLHSSAKHFNNAILSSLLNIVWR